MKVEINCSERNEKKLTTWSLNSMLLKKKKKKKNQWVNEEIKKKIRKYLETNDDADRNTQNIWMPQKHCSEGNSY